MLADCYQKEGPAEVVVVKDQNRRQHAIALFRVASTRGIASHQLLCRYIMAALRDTHGDPFFARLRPRDSDEAKNNGIPGAGIEDERI